MAYVALLGPWELRAGAGRRVQRLTEGLRRQGVDARLTREPSTPPSADAITLQVQRWTVDRPDAVYLEAPSTWADVWRRAAIHLGIRVVVTWHALDRFAPASDKPALRSLMEIFAASSDVLVVETEAQVAEVQSLGHGRLTRIPGCLDPAIFHPGRRSPSLRRSWGAPGDQPVVLFAGRLLREKGIDLLVRTLEILHREVPGLVSVVAGDGPEGQRLRQACPSTHLLGVIEEEDLAKVMASADLLLFPSPEESWGNVVIEALASGLPVVAFPTGAAAEVLPQRCVADEAGFMAEALALARDPQRREAARNPQAVLPFNLETLGKALAEACLPRPRWPVAALQRPKGAVARLPSFGLQTLTATVEGLEAGIVRDHAALVDRLVESWRTHRVAAVALEALDAEGQAAARAADILGLPWIAPYDARGEAQPSWFRTAAATLVTDEALAEAIRAVGGRPQRAPVVAPSLASLPLPEGTVILALASPDLVHLPALVQARAPWGTVRVLGDPALRALAPSATVLGHPPERGAIIAGADLLVILGTGPVAAAAAAEAVVAGTPILAVRQPALEAVVVPGTTGLLVDHAEALVRAAAGLADHLPAREGVRVFAPRHHPDLLTATYARVLRRVAPQL